VLARGAWSEVVAWLAAAVVMFDAAEGRCDRAQTVVDDVIARGQPSLD